MKSDNSPPAAPSQPTSTDARYAQRLLRLQTVWWKRLIDVQAPYRWNLLRLQPGFTLDLGCGIGRNLLHLKGQSIGVDPNAHAVEAAQARGLPAFTPEEFSRGEYCRPARFDSLLLAHVCEHLSEQARQELVAEYLPYVRPGGRVILITPQEAGYRSDATHVEFVDFVRLRWLLERLELVFEQCYSFPFPRWAGRVFAYNEFVTVGRKP